MKWQISCKETSALVSRALDSRLPFGDRIAMRLHLAICRNCARFARQVREMRQLFQAGADDIVSPGLPDDARRRIEAALRRGPDI
ncbi:zf-HC2 domain-containing protein [Betaproteobacteria bacterium SCN1]|jgi:anti-sigma factor RsiW|nr:zf-HC2 domain-containing protein [Betaproteobacteria bacterium SCN1]MBN8759905.1 zf-HC2 domain-containing protein [Thiobacillus sp.]ODU90952.1 MAG: hypothetical protein ABT21_02745 [Thiobacillus sp. SCN 65-179]OJW35622.1 MAG: hypothetical protein BGO61_06455 [Thiobacillus sp. 65-69]